MWKYNKLFGGKDEKKKDYADLGAFARIRPVGRGHRLLCGGNARGRSAFHGHRFTDERGIPRKRHRAGTHEKALAGDIVTYNVSGVTPGNGWIAQQYIGIDDAGSFLQINLFVDSAVTVNKVGGESAGALVIYDATTDQPMANPRSLELGGDWFTGANYIFKYEITKTRLHFYFGLASKIVEGTDAPVSRGYVLLDDKTYGEYTDGIASFAPYAADRSGFLMTVNSISVKGEQANLDMTSMEKTPNAKT